MKILKSSRYQDLVEKERELERLNNVLMAVESINVHDDGTVEKALMFKATLRQIMLMHEWHSSNGVLRMFGTDTLPSGFVPTGLSWDILFFRS